MFRRKPLTVTSTVLGGEGVCGHAKIPPPPPNNISISGGCKFKVGGQMFSFAQNIKTWGVCLRPPSSAYDYVRIL